jgi:hypothetical protein
VNPPICFLDKSIARVTASYLRQATAAQGIIVPSMAFLDDLSRWSCLLFLEKLPTNPAQYIRRAQPERILRLDPGPPPGSG